MQRFKKACQQHGHDFATLDVTKTNIILHAQRPQLRHRGLPIDADWADVVMPRIGTSVTGPGVTVVRQFEAMGVPVVNSSMGIIRARDKLRSLQVLSRSRVDMPKTAFIQNVNDLDAAIEQVGGVPCVVKLLQGTQGIGVMLAESRSALESMLQAFWSLGHCYSPEMDYKRRLGHRIYPRADFLALLHRHRGTFEVGGGASAEPEGPFAGLRDGDAVAATLLVV